MACTAFFRTVNKGLAWVSRKIAKKRMYYTFILNPQAGNHGAAHKKKALASVLQASGLQFELVETSAPGEAVELAKRAAACSEVVVALGGDGTVHEVMLGLMAAQKESQSETALGVFPWGTGNDYAKMLKMPATPTHAVEALLKARRIRADIGQIRYQSGTKWEETFFINQMGIGFEAQAAYEAATFKHLPGKTLPYLVAVLKTLRTWQFPTLHIELEGETPEAWEEPFFMCDLANGACAGGGFWLTPDGKIDDGLLEMCYVQAASKLRILQVLPKALKGTHIWEPEVRMRKAKKVRFRGKEPLALHADGEFLSAKANHIEVQLHAGALPVLRYEGRMD